MYPLSITYAQGDTITPGNQVKILSPHAGQTLQGIVLISGEIKIEDPLLVELSFAYSNDQRDTWFIIYESEDSMPGEISIEWDTTTITDGEYTLRLLVKADQKQSSDIVAGLRVRNYSAIETSTPVPTPIPASADILSATSTPITTPSPLPPTPSPLPPNPAQIDSRDIGMSIGKGGLVVISIFAIMGIYQYVRNRRRNYK